MKKVNCSLRDCIFYHESPSHPGEVFCKHPDVDLNRGGRRCPLYQMDWAKKIDAAESMTRRLKL